MNFKCYPANLLLFTLALVGLPTAYANIPKWQTSATIKTAIHITPSTAGLVFFRPNQQNSHTSTATNIAIDGQHLISLHDGHFASSQVCAGTHRIAAMPTGAFSNDLKFANGLSSLINVPATTIRYVKVSVDSQGAPTLETVNEQIAKNVLVGMSQQSHQINRVTINNCHNYTNPI